VSAPAFSPGPWRIAKRGEDEAFYIVERDEPNEPSRHAYRVAHVLDYNEYQQNAANARLIAAAPELFEALDEMLREFGVDGHGAEFEDGECMVVDRARAALAAATGERP